jgi:hypothetical protein
MDIVVARYNEDLEWIKPLQEKHNVIVYNKGKEIESIESIILPNVGREAYTYLYHILYNYHKLAEYTCFLQGNPFEHCKELYKEIEETNFKPLGDQIFPVDAWGSMHSFLPLGLVYENVFNHEFPGEINFAIGAQFIVSKERIHRFRREIYNKLVDISVSPQGPWIIERLWLEMYEDRI